MDLNLWAGGENHLTYQMFSRRVQDPEIKWDLVCLKIKSDLLS